MSGLSNDCIKLILDAALGGTAFSPSATYLALATTTIVRTDDAASITECAYTGYARALVTDADWSAAADPGTKTNSSVLSLPTCTGAPETATDVAIVETSSGSGLLIAYAELGIPLAIVNGLTPEFDIGALVWNGNPAA